MCDADLSGELRQSFSPYTVATWSASAARRQSYSVSRRDHLFRIGDQPDYLGPELVDLVVHLLAAVYACE